MAGRCITLKFAARWRALHHAVIEHNLVSITLTLWFLLTSFGLYDKNGSLWPLVTLVNHGWGLYIDCKSQFKLWFFHLLRFSEDFSQTDKSHVCLLLLLLCKHVITSKDPKPRSNKQESCHLNHNGNFLDSPDCVNSDIQLWKCTRA